MSNYTQ